MFLSAGPANADAACPLPEDGVWVNPYAKRKEITRIEIESTCQDGTVRARVRAFTSCSPRDCKWGWTDADLRERGGLRVDLVGFLGTKAMTLTRFGNLLDAHVIDKPHDPDIAAQETTYNLIKK
ncbi:serine/threonine protein kinase [Roseibium sp. RKSG952]|nr:serine/threonine protein kinase [Roseibium sp. RKSG952]